MSKTWYVYHNSMTGKVRMTFDDALHRFVADFTERFGYAPTSCKVKYLPNNVQSPIPVIEDLSIMAGDFYMEKKNEQ